MGQKYKVFINNRPLHLIGDVRDYNSNVNHLFIRYDSANTLLLAVRLLEVRHGNTEEAFVYDEKPDRLWDVFCSLFHFVEAAGGLVRNGKGAVLMIKRPSYSSGWDLPKGKLEKDESPRDAAVREVEEECGLQGLELQKELPATYHTYKDKHGDVLKRTYWFEMIYAGDKQPVPRKQEGITEARWFGNDELPLPEEIAYATVSDILATGN